MEFTAVQLLLSASTRCQAPSGRVGYAASVTNIDGSSHTVFVARTSSMGNVPAAEAIAQVREDCPRLQHVIFSGIAGGTPHPARVERHVRLGDIVVATDCIVNYGNRKEHEDHQEVRSQYVPIPDGPLTAAVRRLENAAVAGQRPWDEYIDELARKNSDFRRPSESTDRLIEANTNWLLSRFRIFDRTIRHPVDPARALKPLYPRIFPGRIASADVVQASPSMRDQIRDEQNVRAFEMEGYGFSFGALHRQLSYIVVRGVCDYANARKNRGSEHQWQLYAANVAAGYTLAVIRELPKAPAKQVTELASFARMLQQGGTSFTPDETALLQSAVSAIVAPSSIGLAAAQPEGARTTDSPREGTEQLARDLLGNLDRAEELQRVYDFDQAFAIADQVDHQLAVVESALTPDASTEILFRLAKMEVSRADTVRIQDPNATPDYSRALEFLERANRARHRP
jgi:nucleoside phosphorylase